MTDLPIDPSKYPGLSELTNYIKTITATSDEINSVSVAAVPDMVVFTSSELNNYADDPRYVKYDQGTKTFKQKGGSTRTPLTGDWTLIKSIETLTDSLDFPVGYDRAKISMDRHFEIPVGNKGTGEPYEIFIGGDKSEVDLILDKDYGDLISTLTDEQKRTVKNRGSGNIIRLNNRQIFSGKHPIEFNSPVINNDPYVISQNGDSFEGFKVSGSNDDVCLFVDWWETWGGLDIVGNGTVLVPPVLNPSSGVLQRKVYTDDPAGRFLRYNTPYGAVTDVDDGIHSRTSPTTLATITTFSSGASAEISGITDADAIKLKIGARVQATGLPSPTANTTLISSIVHNGTNDNSIFLIDSETGNAESVTASGTITIDMSGNSKISHQLDQAQGHLHGTSWKKFNSAGATAAGGSISTGDAAPTSILTTLIDVTGEVAGSHGTPRVGDQNRAISFYRQLYLQL